jgi:hypothetical protein
MNNILTIRMCSRMWLHTSYLSNVYNGQWSIIHAPTCWTIHTWFSFVNHWHSRLSRCYYEWMIPRFFMNITYFHCYLVFTFIIRIHSYFNSSRSIVFLFRSLWLYSWQNRFHYVSIFSDIVQMIIMYYIRIRADYLSFIIFIFVSADEK